MKDSTASGSWFFSALVLIFITLKLCHVINWSWWWVFSPWLFPLAIFGGVGIIYVVFKIWQTIR